MQPFPISRLISLFVKELSHNLHHPEKLTFLSLGCEQPGEPVQYDFFHGNLIEVPPQPKLPREPFDEALCRVLLNSSGPSGLSVGLLPKYFKEAAGMKDNECWHVLPLSAFAVPIGFLLLPDQKDLLLHNWYLKTNSLLIEALLTELDEIFSSDRLQTIADPISLCHQFNLAVLPWLAPHTYTLFDGSAESEIKEYFGLLQLDHISKQVLFRTSTQEFRVEYVFHANNPEGFHSPTLFPALQHYFLEILHRKWEHFHKILPNRSIIETKLDRVANLLEELRQDVTNIFFTTSKDAITEQVQSPFTFYLPQGKSDWVIYFNGVRVNMLSSSQRKVGLEAIRILLQHPDRPFSPSELYTKNRYARGQRDSPELDIKENERRKRELLNYLMTFKDALKGLETPIDILNTWRFCREALMVLLEHEPKNQHYNFQYGEASEKIKERINKLDDNFNPKNFKIFNELKPTGSDHNTTTKLQKGIKSAIEILDNDDLSSYLLSTIVVTKITGYEPFIYVPDFSTHPVVRRLPNWNTGDPVM